MTYWKVITFVIGIIHYWRQPRQAGTVPGVCISEKASDTTRRLAVADFISTVNSANVPWLTDGSDLTVFMAQLDLCLAEWAWVRGEWVYGGARIEKRRETRRNCIYQPWTTRASPKGHIIMPYLCVLFTLWRSCYHTSDESCDCSLPYW